MAIAAPLRPVRLEDRYALERGSVLMSGTQVLVRLPLLQREVDAAAGLDTAGFVTGYRGSPLGGYDMELWSEARRLADAQVVFQPGVNEDLAATAVWGTQQAPLLPGTRHEGVFAIWYGKGPGVDRSGDAFKHGNRQGASKHGGVLVCAGDDHPGKSSTVSHQSEQALAANHIPVLYPASVQELLEYGMFGWALSRFSGLWVALKCTNETVEGTSTVEIDPDRFRYARPEVATPPGGLNVNPRPMVQREADETLVTRYRLPAAQAFARANGIDRVVIDAPRRRLGLVATGKGYADTVQALAALGLDATRAASLGLRLYKVGMIWPLEPQGLREFASGHDELLFVEEKAAFVEAQAARVLYDLPADVRPRLTGKCDDQGRPLLAAEQQLQFVDVALAIAERLAALGLVDAPLSARVARLREQRTQAGANAPGPATRTPYFCSGCPHNTSTLVPEGSLALAGIGCHTMAGYMNRRTLMPTQMGGEGLNWTGIAPFSSMPHVFQNLGDGTYFHSGLLAVRGAVAAGVNITYKVLYNDAVAMTGGQPVEGRLTPVEIARQLLAERVRRVALVSDDPDRYRDPDAGVPPEATVHHRDELPALQLELRALPGVTAIVYEQTCAAEKRRRRKRGELADPPKRVFINAAVCEGCGDCSVQSNCVSILPLETEYGRKRAIDQHNCNKDYSCVKGHCPSFVTVHGGRLRKPAAVDVDGSVFAALPPPPLPALPETGAWNVLVAGIGGTGVVTVGAVLAMAAHLEGRRASVVDMTGLAQKNGAVWSHLRIHPPATSPGSAGEVARSVGEGSATSPGSAGEVARSAGEGPATSPGSAEEVARSAGEGSDTSPGSTGEVARSAGEGSATSPGSAGEVARSAGEGSDTSPGSAGEVARSAGEGPLPSRVGLAEADLLLGCDLVTATEKDSVFTLDRERTRAVVNAWLQPTAQFQLDPGARLDRDAQLRPLRDGVAADRLHVLDATTLASRLLGNSLGANFLLVGCALQAGALPVSLAALERAIELNGQAVDFNKRALALGRLAAHDRAAVDALLERAGSAGPADDASKPTLEGLLQRRSAFLAAYQDRAYATRYAGLVRRVHEAERARTPGRSGLAEAVARGYFRLLAYKDEYEVARLHGSPAFRQQLAETFEGDFRLRFHLAPAWLARPDPRTGQVRKREFGPWMLHAFRLLARFRRLRGTALDPFGWQPERRLERRLIADYERLVEELIERLQPDTHGIAVELAALPERVRGFGHVKRRQLEAARVDEAALLAQLRGARAEVPVAA